MKFNWHRVAIILLVVGMLLVLSFEVSAQCSMCRAAVSGAGNDKFLKGLQTGILVLLLPPVSIFCSIFYLLRKHGKDSTHDENDRDLNR